jgi:hypothetical protein
MDTWYDSSDCKSAIIRGSLFEEYYISVCVGVGDSDVRGIGSKAYLEAIQYDSKESNSAAFRRGT